MNHMILVCISCQNKTQAENIGKQLLKARLAACVQIVPGVDSLFFWPPKTHAISQSQETLLLVKTLESKWTKLEKLVNTLHTYDTPEILAIPTAFVSKKYFDWLTKELT